MEQRTELLFNLHQAERQVADGEAKLSRQRELLDTLRASACDTSDAEYLLGFLEQLQALSVADRNHILRTLRLDDTRAPERIWRGTRDQIH